MRRFLVCFFFSSRRRHTRSKRDWSSDVCSSDLNSVSWLPCAGPRSRQFPLKKHSPQSCSIPKSLMMRPSSSVSMEDQDLTPMMRQYHAVKLETPDALLLFRLGDFYELFFDDAVTASRELEITLTARNKDRDRAVPMCGVPYHAADGYIARLLRKGYKVAICDQMETPQKGVKLVKRGVTRVITPGTVTDTNVLTPGENNFLLAISDQDGQLGCAFLDISTGELRVSQFGGDERWNHLLLDVEHF